MPEWITGVMQLGFSVVVAGYLIRFITNHLSHKLDDMHETLKELVEELRDWRRHP